MSFLTPSYLLFFPVVAALYFLLPRRAKNPWLLLCSWAFYLYAGPKYFAFLLFAILSTYAAGLALQRKRGKLPLALALGANIGVLFVFKYLGFAAGLLDRALSLFGLGGVLPGFELILPLGISFYLFQAMGPDSREGKKETKRA